MADGAHSIFEAREQTNGNYLTYTSTESGRDPQA